MKRLCAIWLLLALFLCGCGDSAHSLENSFMPSVMGVDDLGDEVSVTLAGYVPGASVTEPADYSERSGRYEIVSQAFDRDVYLGMLNCVLVGESSLSGGLYRLYSPVIYDGAASEGAHLVVTSDAKGLLDAGSDVMDDLISTFKDSVLPTPTVLEYDIAMRTPGASCVLPVVARTASGIDIVSAEAFIGDRWVYTFDGETLDYVALIRGETVNVSLVFDLGDAGRGACSATLSASVTARYHEELLTYDVVVTGEALVTAREEGHENLFMTGDSSELEIALEKQIAERCSNIIDEAFKNCGRDVFNFNTHALAQYRRELEDKIAEFPAENTRVTVTAKLKIRNLSQIH